MSRKMMAVMLGLTVLPLAAIGVAAYLFVAAGPGMTPVAAAILVLAACILATALLVMVKTSRQEQWLLSHEEALGTLGERTDDIASRLEAVEWHVSQPQEGVGAVAADVAALRRELGEIRTGARAGFRPGAAAEEPAPERPAAPPEDSGSDQLELLLEPVIELASGNTLHYRALLALTDEQGHAVAHDELIEKAELGGMRAALDAHLIGTAAPVLRRLRQKNPGLRIFVPVGLATLGAGAEGDSIIGLMQRDLDVTGGLVFEFAQEELGALDMGGIENLARLGRLGATLALRDVYLGGLDLTALRQLGVRFLSFPPHAVDAGSGATPAWRDFVQYARTMQVQIIISDIKTPQQATAASMHARFGHGPFFAPPRKVRPDAGLAAPSGRSASVA
ncbi:EAL domain-containing protein [Aestuariivirga sp.]|uniref:EAL domain-containing protein n=1 Tax=Aestuariivirga sp. TaxID=2650926 RepID=UPI00391A3FBC